MQTETQKHKLIERAWVVNPSNFEEPYFARQIYYAETAGKAKNKMLPDLDGYKDFLGEYICFLSLRVSRAKDADIYLVGGEKKIKRDIEYDNKKKEQSEMLDSLVANNHDAMAYIKKGGYYYRPNNNGYTEFEAFAGVYPIADAAMSVKGCSLGDCMRMIIINKAEHNKMITDKIEDLKTRLIP